MVTVRAPATTANLGSGYDTFGAALERPADEVTVQRATETTLTVTGAGAEYVPEAPTENTAGVVAATLDAPATIEIRKGIRPASGLGSSAASAAAAAVALNELYDRGYSRAELVSVAAEGEAAASGEVHADNVAPALLGGFTVTRPDGTTVVDAELSLVVCLPAQPISTREARQVVPSSLSMDDHVETVRNAATLTVGMCRSDPALVGRGLDDPVVTPARAALVDAYDAVREAATRAGATGVTISGSGPGVLAVTRPTDQRAVASAMVDGFERAGIDARAIQTGVGDGATIR
ncbi:homoserine kinase [Halobaculum sp. MBLA0143]|uniref:homoserine kinase n=1 Tax=Halobaculum sp. MBLA0143 TaxID=3079933 RepID=UPI003526814A